MIYTTDPGDIFAYPQWREGEKEFPIWYSWEECVILDGGENGDAPEDIRKFIERWRVKVGELEPKLGHPYPVEHAHIEFIYRDVVYEITPETLHASRHYTLEALSALIREELKQTLKLERTRYSGALGGKYRVYN